MFGKTAVLVVSGDSEKNALLEFHLNNSNSPLHGKLPYLNFTLLQMFPVSVLRISKIAMRAPVVDSLFIKATGEISVIYNSFKNSITCIGKFRKVALLEIEILRNFLLIEVIFFDNYVPQVGTILKTIS